VAITAVPAFDDLEALDLTGQATGHTVRRTAAGFRSARNTRVDVTDWLANPYVSGTAYAGKADQLTALQNALNAVASYDQIAEAYGSFRIDGTLVVTGHLNFAAATIDANGGTAVPAIRVGDGTNYLRDKHILLPRLLNGRKTVTGWAASGIAGSAGVSLVNLIGGMVDAPYIYGFETGIFLTASVGKGTEHGTMHLGQVLDNLRGLRIAPTEPTGWANEWLFLKGSFGHSLAERAVGAPWYQSGARHILMDMIYSAPVVASTATGGSASTLVDATLTLTANQHALKMIRITSGTGAGQDRIISSHTAGSPGITFTMSSQWTVPPDATSVYQIVTFSKQNSHEFVRPSLQGDVAEYHADLCGHQVRIVGGRWETHQPGTVSPKVRLTGPFCTENWILAGYDSDAIAFTQENGARANRYDNPFLSHIQGGSKGAVVLQNESSNNTGSVYVVPSGTALGADPTSIYTAMIASAQVAFKATGDTQPRLKITPSTGRIELGPGGSTAVSSGLEHVSTDLLGTIAGDSLRAGSTGAWNAGHLLIGAYHLWVDGSGRLRIKSGAPSSDTDGTIVGAQS
jgi:hypothetical protein